MHEFYAQQDVLLAPSLWPEPFGLVTREALSAGLWVLASDRGAIGEEVSHGVNGWVIDVATPRDLFEVLSEIDSNPEKYLISPPPPNLRSANEQAQELLHIYQDVLARFSPSKPRYEHHSIDRGLSPQKNSYDLRLRADGSV